MKNGWYMLTKDTEFDHKMVLVVDNVIVATKNEFEDNTEVEVKIDPEKEKNMVMLAFDGLGIA